MTTGNAAIEPVKEALEHLVEVLRGLGLNVVPADSAQNGLLSYEGVARRLAIDGKQMSLRELKAFLAKHRKTCPRVRIGHKTVGFRPANVDRLIAKLEEDASR